MSEVHVPEGWKPWALQGAGNCPSVLALGVTCQACEEQLATGHIRVAGGPMDGRLLMLVCNPCGLAHEPVKARLVTWARAGLVDLLTGGPGDVGVPVVWHGDHYDDMPEHEDPT